MDSDSSPGFRDPTLLTNWLRLLFGITIFLGVMAFGFGLLQYKFFGDVQAGVYQTREAITFAGAANDFWLNLFARGHTLSSAVQSIVFLVWVYRANFNARVLGANDMEFSPGWSVGWFFVPFANFWVPFLVMQEIWKASAEPLHWREAKASYTVALWWFLSLALGAMSVVVLFMRPTAGAGIGAFLGFGMVVVVFNFFMVAVDCIGLAVVNGIFWRQMRHVALQLDETFA